MQLNTSHRTCASAAVAHASVNSACITHVALPDCVLVVVEVVPIDVQDNPSKIGIAGSSVIRLKLVVLVVLSLRFKPVDLWRS